MGLDVQWTGQFLPRRAGRSEPSQVGTSLSRLRRTAFLPFSLLWL
uniref:Uncharacterized protein n=1 Tax=Anguilla anguilla TaxID=7936 RepID=A0A0E9PPP7_ANGAN